jgi:hypothetical protein
VSCPSANDCVAVGVNANAADTGKGGGALIQTWNGTTWTSVAPKAPKGAVTATLLGLSCPSATDCIAVGTSGSDTAEFALADAWNGKTWTRMSVQPPASAKDDADLIGVSCTAAKSCVAVGFIDADFNDGGHTGKAAATSWNGKTWTATSGPAPGKGKASLFSQVTCPAAGGCVAVGQLGPYNSDEGSGLAGFWNGRSWKLRTTP